MSLPAWPFESAERQGSNQPSDSACLRGTTLPAGARARGAGGLGATALQLANTSARTSPATASAADTDRCALGADEVVDYRSTDFADVLSDVDVVLGTVGGADLEKSLTVLAPGKLAISVVGPLDPAFARQLGKPLLAPATALSSKIRW